MVASFVWAPSATWRRGTTSRLQRLGCSRGPSRRYVPLQSVASVPQEGGVQTGTSQEPDWIVPRYWSQTDEKWISEDDAMLMNGLGTPARAVGPHGDEPWYHPEEMTDEELGLLDAPLDDIQRRAVRWLLRGRSVLYATPAGSFESHFAAILFEIAARMRLWPGRGICYCAGTHAAAERVFVTAKSILPTAFISYSAGVHRRPRPLDGNDDPPILTITTQETLHNWIFQQELDGIDLIFIEQNLNAGTLQGPLNWEEFLLGIPSRIQVAILSGVGMKPVDAEEVPLWMTAVLGPTGSAVARQQTLLPPAERIFAFNAARNSLQSVDINVSDGHHISLSDSETKDAMLYDLEDLDFGSFEQNEFRDVAAVIVKAIISGSTDKLPVVVLLSGRGECEIAASALASALSKCSNPNSSNATLDQQRGKAAQLAATILQDNRISAEGSAELVFLDMLAQGIAVSHGGLLPSLRSMGELMFNAGLVQVLIADTQMGMNELVSMPQAKTVLVDGGILTSSWNFAPTSGLVHVSVLSSLVGGDRGSIIALWDDPDVSDFEARNEMAASMGSEIVEVKPVGFGKTYSSVLSILIRYGVQDWVLTHQHQFVEFRKAQILQPLLQKKVAIQTRVDYIVEELADVPWNRLAQLERLKASATEQKNILSAMVTHRRIASYQESGAILKAAPPGTMINVLVKDSNERGVDIQFPQGSFSGGLDDVISNVGETEWTTFVGILKDSEFDTQSVVVVCIGGNGLWRAISARDVISVESSSASNTEVTTAAAKLEVPPLSLFKYDDVLEQRVCEAFPGQNSSLETLSLAAAMMNTSSEGTLGLPSEIESQLRKAKRAQARLEEHSWFSQDSRLADITAKKIELSNLREELAEVDVKERQARMHDCGTNLEADLGTNEGETEVADTDRRAILQCLRDAGCLSDDFRQMKPLGIISARLVCREPLWIASILFFAELEKLPAPILFAALCSCVTDMRSEHGPGEITEVPGDGSGAISRIVEIRDEVIAIERNRRRHRGEGASPTTTAGFRPARAIVDTRLCGMAKAWAGGAPWNTALSRHAEDFEPGDVLRALKETCSILEQLVDESRLPGFDEEFRAVAREALQEANRFPVKSGILLNALLDETEIEARMAPRQWNDNFEAPPPPKRGRGRRKKKDTEAEAALALMGRCEYWWTMLKNKNKGD